MTARPGLALLIELSPAATPAGHGAMGLLGELLVSCHPAIEVSRLAPELSMLPGPDCATVKRHIDAFVDSERDVGVLIISAVVAETPDGPALVVGPHWRDYPRESTVPLAWLGERLRAARPASLFVALVLSAMQDDGERSQERSTPPHRPSWPDLLRTLGEAAPDRLVIVHDSTLLDVVTAGLRGDALDLGTGTITLRSLGRYLARSTHGAGLQLSDRASTILSPPSRVSAVSWPALLSAPARDESEPAELDGRILPGRFRIERELARGGFGVVYLARQLTVNRDVWDPLESTCRHASLSIL